jgi:O-antigen ligase
MANIYNFSRNALLRRIGLTPGKRLLIFLISITALTIPMGYVYNSVAVILFVACSIMSVRRQDISIRLSIALPVALFLLMVLSATWSINARESVKALGKEASLFFIPLAFILNPPLNRRSVDIILKNYSLGMCFVGVFLILRALFRYISTGNVDVFFYHELSTLDVNAIYLSALFSLAFVIFMAKKTKTFWGYGAMGFLMLLIILLSSKNLILINIGLIIVYYVLFSGFSTRAKITSAISLIGVFAILGFYTKIHERFVHELQTDNSGHDSFHHVTLKEAATREKFNENCYFNGTAFRVYQVRVFKELITQEPIFFTGYGLSGSKIKIEEKGQEHNLYQGDGSKIPYTKMNYHNQYIETFSDLGVFGFIIIVAMLFINLKNGIKNKYFIQIAFATLMISVFLTESFLWRQRGVVFFTLFYCLFNDMQPLTKGLRRMAKPHAA